MVLEKRLEARQQAELSGKLLRAFRKPQQTEAEMFADMPPLED